MDWLIPSINAVGQIGAAAAAPRPAGPTVSGADPWSMFDASGWNVNFGAGTIESARAQTAPMSGYLPYVIAAGAFLVLWRWAKK